MSSFLVFSGLFFSAARSFDHSSSGRDVLLSPAISIRQTHPIPVSDSVRLTQILTQFHHTHLENTSMRSASRIHLRFLAALCLIILPFMRAAAQPAPASSDDLVRQSDVVVVGRVSTVRSEWSADRSRILSRVTVAIDEHIKGDASQRSIVITTPGGEVGGVGEVYSHTAHFKTEEQVVVFAATDREGALRVVGGDGGKLLVSTDQRTGLRTVANREPLSVFTSRLRKVVEAQSHRE
jgi:hypothetical protein